jgi:hypothetical protein
VKGFHLRNYSEDIVAEGVNKEFLRSLAHVVLPHVYIAGPYVYEDFEENCNAAIDMAEELYTTGVCLPVIPSLTYYWQQRHQHSAEHWNEYCFQVLKRCDAVLVYDSESSTGTIDVVEEAERIGIPVFYMLDDLTTWVESDEDIA